MISFMGGKRQVLKPLHPQVVQTNPLAINAKNLLGRSDIIHYAIDVIHTGAHAHFYLAYVELKTGHAVRQNV